MREVLGAVMSRPRVTSTKPTIEAAKSCQRHAGPASLAPHGPRRTKVAPCPSRLARLRDRLGAWIGVVPVAAARALGLRAVLRRRAGDGVSGLGLAGRLPLRDRAGAAPRPAPLVEPVVLRRLPGLGLRRGGDQPRLALDAVLSAVPVPAGAAARGGGCHARRRRRRLSPGRAVHAQPRLARVRRRRSGCSAAAGRCRSPPATCGTWPTPGRRSPSTSSTARWTRIAVTWPGRRGRCWRSSSTSAASTRTRTR